MAHQNTSKFKQRANGGGGRNFRKSWAESHSGRWDKNRAKEWVWIEEAPQKTKTTTAAPAKKTKKKFTSSKNLGV